MKRAAFLLGIAAAGAAAVPARADAISAEDAIARLFTAATIDGDWFAPGFLAAIPIGRVRALIADIRGALGAYRDVTPNGVTFTVDFAQGSVQAAAAIDRDGLMTALVLGRMQSAAAADQIANLFTTESVPPAWFSEAMLAGVPIDRIRALLATMKSQLGAFGNVVAVRDGSYDLAFENGHAIGIIFLGADGKIEGLVFRPKNPGLTHPDD